GNYLPVPPKLYRKGIKDYVRITDARMSGGATGTVVLHVSPESAVCGPLAAVRDGDIITLDTDRNMLHLEISDDEMTKRLAAAVPKEHPDIRRGFIRNFIDNVLQADEGCDMKYL
ncbi:MAG: dihydroxy-acid dehydratase, partial [Eubacteriales bacterium]|nr:dihydroxy-acid dehydratase [Eubacteriales bacterium]